MKPDWDKLMDEFKDSKTALIADVDCTAAGKDLCEKHKVEGFPTIKHGDPNDLKKYEGGRTYDALKKFAEENLGPTCSPEYIDLCNDEDKALIERFQKMNDGELDKAIEEVDVEVAKIEAKSQNTVEGLQEKISGYRKEIEAETKKKEDAVSKESKKKGLKAMRAVLAAKKKKDGESDKKKKKGKKNKEL